MLIPMFSPTGFRAFVDDLMVRMINPYVRDTIARVGRDPARKLGWNDRLVGAMRLAAADTVAYDTVSGPVVMPSEPPLLWIGFRFPCPIVRTTCASCGQRTTLTSLKRSK